MFVFIPSVPSDINNNLWYTFISNLHYNCINNNIIINQDLLNAILIQTIYKHYILSCTPLNSISKSPNIIYNFNSKPKHYTDIIFWKVCTISYNDIFYLYHKTTNAILLSLPNNTFEFIGILDTKTNLITYKKDCDNIIQNWFIKSGFV